MDDPIDIAPSDSSLFAWPTFIAREKKTAKKKKKKNLKRRNLIRPHFPPLFFFFRYWVTAAKDRRRRPLILFFHGSFQARRKERNMDFARVYVHGKRERGEDSFFHFPS